MSWLLDRKVAVEKEQIEKEEEDTRIRQAAHERLNEAKSALATFIRNTLQEVDGKITKDKKILQLVSSPYLATVTLFANEDKLLSIGFFQREITEWEGSMDLSLVGTGRYTIDQMICYGSNSNGYETLDIDKLADYLLTILM